MGTPIKEERGIEMGKRECLHGDIAHARERKSPESMAEMMF